MNVDSASTKAWSSSAVLPVATSKDWPADPESRPPGFGPALQVPAGLAAQPASVHPRSAGTRRPLGDPPRVVRTQRDCARWRAKGARRAATSGWRIRAAALGVKNYLDISATPHHGGPGRQSPRDLPRGATSPAGPARTGPPPASAPCGPCRRRRWCSARVGRSPTPHHQGRSGVCHRSSPIREERSKYISADPVDPQHPMRSVYSCSALGTVALISACGEKSRRA